MGADPVLDSLLERAGHRVGLVFADIVGSTLLLHDRGTEVYARILTAYRSRADRLAAAGGGRIISHEGDEIFAVLPTATTAYVFARGLYDDAGHPLLSTRLGVHVGLVHRHETGVVGRAVPFAARVMAHAAARQLWVSDAVKLAVESESPIVAASIDWMASEDCLLDGVPGSQRLWRAA